METRTDLGFSEGGDSTTSPPPARHSARPIDDDAKRHVLEQRVLTRGKFTRVGRHLYAFVVVSVRGAVTDVWSVKPVVYGAGVE